MKDQRASARLLMPLSITPLLPLCFSTQAVLEVCKQVYSLKDFQIVFFQRELAKHLVTSDYTRACLEYLKLEFVSLRQVPAMGSSSIKGR